MRFLTDRCAGRRLAEWLRSEGHDVVEAQSLGPDPGDRALLELAESENRVLVTMDKDFGELDLLATEFPTLASYSCRMFECTNESKQLER